MNTIIKAYLDGLTIGGKSINTIRSYERTVTEFFQFFNLETIEDLNALTVSDIHRFYQSKSNLKASSLNAVVLNLSAFFSWLRGSGYISDHAFFNVKFGNHKFIKVAREKKVILTSEESDCLIEAGWNEQERFMLALMLFTALRRGAISKMKVSDVDGNTIRVIEKGNKVRKTYMDKKLVAMFEKYMATRKTESEFVFYNVRGEGSETGMLTGESINNRVKAAAKRAGITKAITAHRLRGTRITDIIRKRGIHAAQKVAGHSSVHTTSLYDSTDDAFVQDVLLNEGE